MPRPIASLSLDLDNKWAYLRSGGRDGWEAYPSYLPVVAPRFDQFCKTYDLKTTLFVVGEDLRNSESASIVGGFHQDGHEIANHSQNHYPWLERLTEDELFDEVTTAEHLIEKVTGQRPVGFRGPGFSRSESLMKILAQRGYLYDSSIFPTLLGPLASLYASLSQRGQTNEPATPKQRFAGVSDGFRSIRPHKIQAGEKTIVEIPVTTMPLLRIPIHVTYLMFLRQYSRLAASAYLGMAMKLCRLRGVGPVMLLHPLDFLGGDEEPELTFVPGMKLTWPIKQQLLASLIEAMQLRFQVATMEEQAQAILK